MSILELDRAALIGYLMNRVRADSDWKAAYWAGRVDGHCLQNAIGIDDLRHLATNVGLAIDWPSALEIDA